jgi:hypothetical protein
MNFLVRAVSRVHFETLVQKCLDVAARILYESSFVSRRVEWHVAVGEFCKT